MLSKASVFKGFYLSPAVIISIWIQVHPTKLTVLLTVLLVRVRRQTLWNHLTLFLSDTFLPVTYPV